jgi:hypothetical protein
MNHGLIGSSALVIAKCMGEATLTEPFAIGRNCMACWTDIRSNLTLLANQIADPREMPFSLITQSMKWRSGYTVRGLRK